MTKVSQTRRNRVTQVIMRQSRTLREVILQIKEGMFPIKVFLETKKK